MLVSARVVNFLHSGWDVVVFWVCSEHSVGNIVMFLLFLSRVYTGPRHFLLFVLPQW